MISAGLSTPRWARAPLVLATVVASVAMSACAPPPQTATPDSDAADPALNGAGALTARAPSRDSTAFAVQVDTPPRPVVRPADSTRLAGTGRDTADRIAQADTSKPLTPLPLVAGRSRRDSISLRSAIRAGSSNPGWPVAGPELLPGAILPHSRIIAFYGNPLSKRMGILGQYPSDQMLAKLDTVVGLWQAADPGTPVQPALHLVAMVAQADAGRDGKYRLKMADTLIERVAQWAATRNALVFLDLQVGTSSIEIELPRYQKFIEMPNVHIGIDPEFSMKGGHKPGTRVGTNDAADINWVVRYLSGI
ncbi:MAG TPA: hypothetical protein VMM77_07575, partial [Gemmatimonadaceae bacterium]|nr:hypothetical protein [Gemmatimonadaceae bacterium]